MSGSLRIDGDILRDVPGGAPSRARSAKVGDGGTGGKSSIDAGSVVNPDTIGNDGNDGNNVNNGDAAAQPRKRGRPVGSTNKTKKIPFNVNSLEKVLVGFHNILAAITKYDGWQLDTESADFDGKSEARYLADSAKPIVDRYTPAWLDDSAGEMVIFVEALIAVYGGRLYAMKQSRRVARPSVAPPPAPGVKPTEPVMRQGPLRDINGQRAVTDPPDKPNGLNVGEISGLGSVEFPPDHPLMGGRTH